MQCGPFTLTFGQKTLIMGILNTTPDSFYDGGRYTTVNKAVERGIEIAAEGADIIDIGGESTRPGSESISPQEEMDRILPVIEALSKKINIPISIDTTKSDVAAAAIAAGAAMVNDISGFHFDKKMAFVVAGSGLPAVVMHTRGRPKDMQKNTDYDSLMGEIKESLADSLSIADIAGIKKDKLIVDPGIGFGKSAAQNFEILRKLSELKTLGCPILVGPSRKSFIGKTLGLPPDECLEGTGAAVAAAILNGGDIVRVHDVKYTKTVAGIADAVRYGV